MNRLNEFLGFLVENKDNDSINIVKKMKYGFRNYYIYVSIEKEEDASTNSTYFRDRLVVTIDNRNVCIELEYDYSDQNIVIEDKEMVDKWSKIIEESLSENMESKIDSFINKTIEGSAPDLNREFKLKKIFE